MPESQLHHPQPPTQETGGLELPALNAEMQQPPSSHFRPEVALAIQRLLKRGIAEDSALHD